MAWGSPCPGNVEGRENLLVGLEAELLVRGLQQAARPLSWSGCGGLSPGLRPSAGCGGLLSWPEAACCSVLTPFGVEEQDGTLKQTQAEPSLVIEGGLFEKRVPAGSSRCDGTTSGSGPIGIGRVAVEVGIGYLVNFWV